MANIDERLMAASNADRERQAAASGADKQRQGELSYSDRSKQEKMAGADKERQEESEPKSLRQRVQSARQAMDLKQKAKDKIEEKVTAPARAATSNILRWAWGILIPSFGLSLIYINIHVFLRFVVGEKLFCKLGEEWIPKQISAVGGEASKSVGKSIGIIEVMVLLFLDLLALLIIMSALGILVMIADFMQAGFIKKVATIVGGLTNMGWSGIKALFNLFASTQ